MSTPTAAAMRAATLVRQHWPTMTTEESAALVDRETGLPELIDVLKQIVGVADMHGDGIFRKQMREARAALKKAGAE